MVRILLAGAATIAVVLSTSGVAQSSGQMVLHNKGHFKGVGKVIAGPRQFIDPPFVVKSVTIPPGTQWELCSGNTYSGCRQVSESDPSMVMTVRSARPVAAILTSSAQGLAAVGQSVRGLASEYFVSPAAAGNRVEVTPGTAEAMTRQAGEFCRTHGWRTSAYERLQTVGGRFYLADVLCVDDPGR